MNLPFFTRPKSRLPDKARVPEFGPLEREVMEMIWRRSQDAREVSVRDVHLAFHERLAYTTLMTTLDRLHKKGLLDRRKDGRAFLYSPRVSSQEFERGWARDVIDLLLGRGQHGVEPVLACIVEAVSDHDRELLDELDRLIQEKRQQTRRKE